MTSFCIIWWAPHPRASVFRRRTKRTGREGRRPREDGNRDLSDAATSQAVEEARKGSPSEPSEGALLNLTWMSGLREGERTFSVVSSHQVDGNMLQ